MASRSFSHLAEEVRLKNDKWTPKLITIIVCLVLSGLGVLLAVVYMALAASVGCPSSSIYICTGYAPVDIFTLERPLQSPAFISARESFGSLTLEQQLGLLRLHVYSSDNRPENIAQAISNSSLGAIADLYDPALLQTLKSIGVAHYNPLLSVATIPHGYATIFPSPPAMAASFDPSLMYEVARAIAQEARQMGHDMAFAPPATISRDPRWGGTSLSFGEDSYLASEMALNMVRGFEREGLGSCLTDVGSPGAVRKGGDTPLHLSEFYQEYLQPFRNALFFAKGARIASHLLGGRALHDNHMILTGLIRGEWDFRGVLFGANNGIEKLVGQNIYKNVTDALSGAWYSGIEVLNGEAPVSPEQGEEIANRVTPDRYLLRDHISLAASRMFQLKHDLGLYAGLGIGQRPAPDTGTRRICSDTTLTLARQASERSMVLLKNTDHTLPFNARGSVFIGGYLSDSPFDQLGPSHAAGSLDSDYGGCAERIVTYAGALRAAGLIDRDGGGGSSFSVTYQQFYSPEHTETISPGTFSDTAESLTSRPDIALYFIGEYANQADSDNPTLALPEEQRLGIAQFKRVLGEFDERVPVVLVVCASRPLIISEEFHWADAVVWAWHGGTMAGEAFRGIFLGQVFPSATMPFSVPRHLGQIPLHYSWDTSLPRPPNEFDDDFYTAGIDDPLINFGSGLSYGTFDVVLPESAQVFWNSSSERPLVIRADVRKNFSQAASVVLQLYIRKETSNLKVPRTRLMRFQIIPFTADDYVVHILIGLGESHDFGVYNDCLDWVTEKGNYTIFIGFESFASRVTLDVEVV